MKPRILIIDDDSVQCELMSDVLSHYGYECVSASSGEDAVLRLEENLPDLILADLQLSEMSGYDFCRALQAKNRTIPVIAMTGRVLRENDQKKGRALGIADYFLKPVEFDRLKTRMDELLRQPRAGSGGQ